MTSSPFLGLDWRYIPIWSPARSLKYGSSGPSRPLSKTAPVELKVFDRVATRTFSTQSAMSEHRREPEMDAQSRPVYPKACDTHINRVLDRWNPGKKYRRLTE